MIKMVHTIEFITYPVLDDIQVIKNNFSTVKDKKGNINYYANIDDIKYNYYSAYNCLKIVVNSNKILNKNGVVDEDYNKFIEAYKKKFYKIFQFTDPLKKLSRVDFKVDMKTENKELYLKLLHKSHTKYRHLKQKKEYADSVYFQSKSININLYDKEKELINKNNGSTDIDEYADVLRFEVQVKRPIIRTNIKKDGLGLVDDLVNYFKSIDRDYYLNKYLKNIVYSGDYYNQYHSEKVLKNYYNQDKVNKLIELQKQISKVGITSAKENYSPETFRNYINQIQEAGVNPILIPKNEGITNLSSIFNFTDKNIYLLDNFTFINSPLSLEKAS